MTIHPSSKEPVTAESLGIRKIIREVVNRAPMTSSPQKECTLRVNVSLPAVSILNKAA